MGTLAETFLEARPDETLDVGALEPILARVLASAQAAWPNLDVDSALFMRFLARLGPAATLEGRHLDDVYAACGCASGSNAAIAAVQARATPALERALTRLGASDELMPALWERLFTGATPRIATFTGAGPLEAWLRVSLTRAAIDQQRVKHRDVLLEDGDTELHQLADGDLELAFIERQYREAFRQAFLGALAGLEAEERNLLRLHYRDGLTVDQLAVVLGVHRATAARRVARCRAQVLDVTRVNLGEQLRLSTETAESLVRHLGANLDLSLSQALATPKQ